MYYVCIICMYYMYVLVCIIGMYYRYVLYVCIICMYHMYLLYVYIICIYYMYVKLRGQVALQGQKSMEKHNLQIQGRMHIFEKVSQMA